MILIELKVNDGYQLRLSNGKMAIDLYAIYNSNTTHEWFAYHYQRKKLRFFNCEIFSIKYFLHYYVIYNRKYLTKVNELCSAEFLNSKYLVPCDPVKRLNEMYGYNDWETNIQVNFLYKFENLGFWSDREWPNVNKYYDISGKLNLERTLSHANTYNNTMHL